MILTNVRNVLKEFQGEPVEGEPDCYHMNRTYLTLLSVAPYGFISKWELEPEQWQRLLIELKENKIYYKDNARVVKLECGEYRFEFVRIPERNIESRNKINAIVRKVREQVDNE